MKEKTQPYEISSILQEELANFDATTRMEEVGTVVEIGDGVALVYGLRNVMAGEVVLFESGSKGIALNLENECVGVIILDSTSVVKEGDHVSRTHELGSIGVGEGLIGRVIDTLGKPIDNKGAITGELLTLNLERKAPGVIYREPVMQPLQTGIKKIDTMIPIGLGQRQLIIGDRQTGKTTIAIDTILNQRQRFDAGDPVYCIYVAIGQKASTVARLASLLESRGAMDYTTIIVSSASERAALQYLAPFAGITLGEYFRDTGRHALVIFDDLSKHAVYYRELSLLLKRLPGREAYPGDIFYLHARLLERGAKINSNDYIARQMNDLPAALQDKVKGGGSLTVLPIIESQEGDVSAYIPTNVISITDGQIFLETELFNVGIRPAINIGISVSRVGGAAQLQSMKKVAGKLKLEQAQFLEVEAFSKFGSELDATTQRIIDRGRKNSLLLNQLPYQPIPVGYQIATMYASVHGFLKHVPLESVLDFEEAYIKALLRDHFEVLTALAQGEFTKKLIQVLDKVSKDVAQRYSV